jgi:HKD family nuclease
VKLELVGHSTPRPLLMALRQTLEGADDAILCSAFVKRAGVHLVEPQLRQLGTRARFVATSVFGGPSTHLAMAALTTIGVRLRVANPLRGTFHPKVYVARNGETTRALIGSANLTGGLVTNVETAAFFTGPTSHPFLADVWVTANEYWQMQDARTWEPPAAEGPDEGFAPELLQAIELEVIRDPVFLTLARREVNHVVAVEPTGLWVETAASQRKKQPPQLVPAWMFQLAWDYLAANGVLTNRYLLATDGLNVKRSSAVMAILARLPGVEATDTRPVTVRYSP